MMDGIRRFTVMSLVLTKGYADRRGSKRGASFIPITQDMVFAAWFLYVPIPVSVQAFD